MISFFQKTVNFFLLAMVIFSGAGAAGKDQSVHNKHRPALAKTLMEFSGAANEPSWTAVNDGVMGGLSKGGAKIKDGLLHFSGTLSLENDGGFSSVSAEKLSLDFSANKYMILRLKGDGRTYQFRVGTDARFRGSRIDYYAEFPTKADEWIKVKVPLEKLTPSHHGDDLDGPPLDLSKIEEISLLIGDKQPGPFSLKVDWMKLE